ncbi:nuclear transport factor 2 family protein [Methylomonas sp. AM2-LC]|uniref:nuclear transport factor 2 family protein n=1 Tax=Methylomonas sp. AM2-LC TaxID=3153301 RepID=UPI00326623D9
MLDQAFADYFASEWVAAWNAHNLDRILAHYSDDFEMTSPIINKLTGVASGTLSGKTAVAAYWAKALTLYPGLHFELINTLIGVNSICIYYQGVSGFAAEVFYFNTAGKVVKACAHYRVLP